MYISKVNRNVNVATLGYKNYASGLSGLSATESPAIIETATNWTDAILNTIGKAIPLWQQQQVFKAQLKLAKQQAQASGSMINVGDLNVPAIPVSVGMDTNTKMMIGLGIGALALILLMKKR